MAVIRLVRRERFPAGLAVVRVSLSGICVGGTLNQDLLFEVFGRDWWQLGHLTLEVVSVPVSLVVSSLQVAAGEGHRAGDASVARKRHSYRRSAQPEVQRATALSSWS